jgi:hypothetical protein
MPMVMPFAAAWEKIVRECVDVSQDLVELSKEDIERTTGNELRLMAKMDSSADVPPALKKHGYFILPIKNGAYVLVRGNGYHKLESLGTNSEVFKSTLDYELSTLDIGDSEMQHLDYCYHVGLVEHFANAMGLRQTIRGRKRMPPIKFFVGKVGPISVERGVQIEVDSGLEGQDDVILIEAKAEQPRDFIIRQLFYPYRKWRYELRDRPKRIRPWFFCSYMEGGRRVYKFWEYRFDDDDQYLSLVFERGRSFIVEPQKKRLNIEDLVRAQAQNWSEKKFWDVPQADSFWRVADLPLLVDQGIDTAAKLAAHYRFDPRQSSYYRQAAEILGLVALDPREHRYRLTDLGKEYVTKSSDQRRALLAQLLVRFPPMRAVLEKAAKAGERGIDVQEIAALIERYAKISKTTPARRARTLISWLKWLQAASGAVEERQGKFVLR